MGDPLLTECMGKPEAVEYHRFRLGDLPETLGTAELLEARKTGMFWQGFSCLLLPPIPL